ncbi:MAG: glycosyltransferase family 1 protein [Myxococcales bacterium]|nr:MAG: glycosyltransferase family 1 protein [Myxococcales bacterium]
MRILQIARRFVAEEWGGTETAIARATAELAARGHETELWTSAALSRPGRAVVAGAPVRRFRYCYPLLGLDAAAKAALDKKGGNLLSFSMFAALVAAPPFDIYHLHTGKRLGAEAAFVASRRGRPYVLTLHGGVYAVPEAERESLLAPVRGRFDWGRPFGALWGSRRLLDHAAAIFCVNADEVDAVRERHPGRRVLHLPNGVKPEDFAGGDGARFRAAHGFAASDRLMLCLSRIDPQKNQLALVEAAARLAGEESPPKVVLIGPVTDADYARRLDARAAELGLGDRFRRLPSLPYQDKSLADAYAAADVFVLPSRHEPFGIVVLEAWAAGRPVVAARVGGLARLCEHERDALLVEPDDGEALSDALRRVLDDAALARKLGDAGRKKAIERYSWGAVVDQLLDVYRTAIAEARR